MLKTEVASLFYLFTLISATDIQSVLRCVKLNRLFIINRFGPVYVPEND